MKSCFAVRVISRAEAEARPLAELRRCVYCAAELLNVTTMGDYSEGNIRLIHGLRLLDSPTGADPSALDGDDEFYTLIHRTADQKFRAMREGFLKDVRAFAATVDRAALERALAAKDQSKVLALVTPPADFLGELPLPEVFKRAADRTMAETLAMLRQRAARLRLGADFALVFDDTNPRAARKALLTGSDLIQQITETMRDAIRERVSQAFTEGVPPRELAGQIIEEGLGLDSRRMDRVVKFRSRLTEEGVVGERLDVRVGRFYNATLRERATMIARTETMAAAGEGQLEAWHQVRDAGLVEPQTQREWIVTPDDRLDQEICEPMDGVLTGLDTPWTLPDGREAMVPADAHPNDRCTQALVIDDSGK